MFYNAGWAIPVAARRSTMPDWLSPVDDYLYSTGRVGLEQVLCDGQGACRGR